MKHRYRLAAIFLTLFIVFSCSRSQSPIEGSLPDSYTVTTNVSPEGAGEVTPSGGEFLDGSRIEFRANPSDDFVFENWSGDITGSSNPTSLTIRRNLNVTANFVPRDYELTIEIIGEGVVREEVIDRVVESQSSGDLSATSSAADSAERDSDQQIDRRGSDDRIGGGDDQVQSTRGGDIRVNQTTLSNTLSTTVELTAEPAEGWFFARWEGDLEGDENPQQIIVDEPKSVTAVFEEIPELQLVVNIEGEGTVDIDPDEEIYGEGDEVTLTATPADEWEFRRWQGDESSEENPLIITMDENKEITAVFGRAGSPEQEITQQPSDNIAGEPISPAPAVQILTPDGDPLEGISITASLNQSQFSGESTTSAETDSDGVATFSSLRINTADEGYRINFSADADDVSSVKSSTFDIAAADGDPDESSADVPDGVAGETTVIMITVQDRFGNPVSGAAADLSVSVTGANSASPDVETAGDPGEYRAEYVPVSIGTDEISIELGGAAISGSPYSSEVSTSDVSASNSSVTAEPETVEAGESSEITITLRDEVGNPVSGIADELSFGNLGDAAADDIEETADDGVYRSAITSAETGEVTVVVTADGVTLDDQPVITFVAGPPAEIEIVSGNNQSAEVASELSDPIVVRVTDAFGNPVEGTEVDFEFDSVPAGATGEDLGTPAATTDEDGLAKTTVTLGTTPGTYTITADAGTGDVVTFSASAQIGTVAGLSISQQPEDGTAGEPLNPAPAVTVVDEQENVIEGVSVSVSAEGADFTSGSTTTSVTESDGVAAFDNLVIESAGSGYALVFSVNNGDLSSTSDEFNIGAAEPQAGNTTANVPSGSAGDRTSISITMEDDFGNRVEGAADRLSITITGDNSDVSPETIEDEGNGVYEIGYRPVTVGTDQIAITLDGNDIQGSPFTSNVVTSDADAVTIVTQPEESVAGEAIGGPPSVRVDDEFGNPVEDVEVSVSLVGGGRFSGGTETVSSGSDGIATFDDLVLNSAGSYTLRFNTVGADEDADSDKFDVIAADPSAPESSATVPDGTAGEKTTIQIDVRDSFGNPVDGVASQISVSVSGANSADPTVSSASAAGRYTTSYTPENSGTDNIAITRNGTGIDGSPFTSEVTAGGLSAFEISNISNQTAGSSFTISVTALDASGNIATGFDGTPSVSVNDGDISPNSLSFSDGEASGAFTITEVGTDRQITFESGSVTEVSNTFDVSAADADPLATTVTVPDGVAGDETEILINVEDAFGNPVDGVEGDLSVSVSGENSATLTVSPTGTEGQYQAVYTPESSGTDVIAITLSGDPIEGSPFESQVSAGTIETFEISTISDQAAGSSFAVSITARDANDNIASGFDGNASVSVNSGDINPETVSFESGVASDLFTITVAGANRQITVTSGSVSVTSNSFSVSPGAPSASNTTASVPGGVAGDETEILINVEDAFGNPVDGVEGDLSVSVSGENSATLTVSPTGTEGQYQAVYTPESSGTDVIAITLSGDDIQGSPFESQVSAGTIEMFEISTISDQTAGSSFAVSVTALDAGGNVATGFDGTATVSVNSGDIDPNSLSFSDGEASGAFTITEAGTDRQISFESGSVTEVSNSFDVSAAAASPSNTTASVPGGVAGEVTEILINVEDAFGNAVDGVEGDLTISVSGENFASPTVSPTGTEGQYQAVYTPESSGTDVIAITLSGDDIQGSPFESQVSAGDVASFSVEPIGDQQAGVEFELNAEALDGSDNLVDDFSGTVILSANEGDIVPAEATFTGGVLSQNVFVTKSGSDRVVSILFNGATGESGGFTVTPGGVDSLSIEDGDNQTGPVGEELNEELVVRVTDEFDNPIDGEEVNFSFSTFPVGAIGQLFSESTNETDTDGFASTSVRLGDTPGEYTVEAAADGESALFTLTAKAGSVSSVGFETQPEDAIAGEPLSPAPQAVVTDGSGNPLSGVSVAVSLNTGDFESGTFEQTTNSDGIATFPDLVIETAGEYRIEFEADGLSSGLSDQFTIEAAAAEIDIVSGNNQSGPILQQLSDPLVVVVRDEFDNRFGGESVNFQMIDEPVDADDAEPSETSVNTNTNGEAEIFFRLGNRVGTYVVEASINNDEVTFTVEATPGEPESITVTQQPSETAAGESIEPAPAVRVTDVGGNDVPGAEVAVSLEGGTFQTPPGAQTTDSNGLAEFSGLSVEEAGSYTLLFSADGIDDLESGQFDIVAAEPSAEESTVETSSSDPNVGDKVVVTVSLQDAFENVIAELGDNDFEITLSGDGVIAEEIEEIDGQPGSYTFEITSESPGDVLITVTVRGIELNDQPIVTFTSGA